MLAKELTKLAILFPLGIILGIVFSVLCEYPFEDALPMILFIPLYLIGVYYCGTPWKRVAAFYAGLFGICLYQNKTGGDRFHIVPNIIGAFYFAFVITLGWIYGLIKCIYKIVRAAVLDYRGEYDLEEEEEEDWYE